MENSPQYFIHIEADTRIILEASKSMNSIVVKAEDTDILILMCYAHSMKNCTNKWIMNIDSERFVDISVIRSHFGDNVCNVLPSYHSTTGCDTTSYPLNIGKVKALKKMIQQNNVDLLSELGSSLESFKNLDSAKVFFQKVISIVELRTRPLHRQVQEYT